jgi:hypothetical protein
MAGVDADGGGGSGAGDEGIARAHHKVTEEQVRGCVLVRGLLRPWCLCGGCCALGACAGLLRPWGPWCPTGPAHPRPGARGGRHLTDVCALFRTCLCLQEDDELVQAALTTRPSTRLQHQPSLIVGGTMRDYQLEGLNWMINLHDNGAPGPASCLGAVACVAH